MKNKEIKSIELLEKQLSQKIKVYKAFQNSANNESYFNNLHYRAICRMESKENKTFFQFKTSVGYAILFVISFMVSFQLIDFDSVKTLSEANYLFSETSHWLEEEVFLSNNINEDFNLDYTSYLNAEIDYSSINYLNNEMNQLSESEFDEIYKNIKNKKIL